MRSRLEFLWSCNSGLRLRQEFPVLDLASESSLMLMNAFETKLLTLLLDCQDKALSLDEIGHELENCFNGVGGFNGIMPLFIGFCQCTE
jgi:hypothetical protein